MKNKKSNFEIEVVDGLRRWLQAKTRSSEQPKIDGEISSAPRGDAEEAPTGNLSRAGWRRLQLLRWIAIAKKLAQKSQIVIMNSDAVIAKIKMTPHSVDSCSSDKSSQGVLTGEQDFMAAGDSSGPMWTVKTLIDGQISESRLSLEDARMVLGEREFDVVVDESQNLLRVGKKTELLHKVTGSVRGMLWLVLTTKAPWILTNKNIDRFFGHDHQSSKGDASCDGRVQQTVFRFRNFLGEDLQSKILGGGKNKTYPIHSTGWSYCWIRKDEEIRKSRLLPSRESPGN